jgi:hypothetical protein
VRVKLDQPEGEDTGGSKVLDPEKDQSVLELFFDVPASGKGAGDSTIHQFQLEALKRYSNGVSVQLEYSWNRSLDNTPIVGGPQDPHRGPRQGRQPWRQTAPGTWDLQSGRRRRPQRRHRRMPASNANPFLAGPACVGPKLLSAICR